LAAPNTESTARPSTHGNGLNRRRGGSTGGGGSPGTLSVAVLALLMCLLVLGVAGAVVLRDGLRERTVKGATVAAPRPRAHRHRPVRSGVVLVAWTTGVGILTGAALGLVGVGLALALRSLAGESP
jgi:hypothetical protein